MKFMREPYVCWRGATTESTTGPQKRVWQKAGVAKAMSVGFPFWRASATVRSCSCGRGGVDESIIKAAQVDGAGPVRIYTSIIVPSLRPVFFSALIILSHIAIKSFDLVMALTGGGPGFSSDMPATFMYTFAFNRNQIGLGAASAMMMLMTVVAIIVPLMYSETRRQHRG